ncbi:helix-turn-helix domain-containing protein [Mycolicibacter senuensis]|uniref:helix-turn-helix domain-containing protein n=1 Tax=Mycolicibacter senuensis TaxID=386913 RepID=UPI000DCCC701|nr:helix-turn-helix transcriptional regulator [Mycolicibacter senuensis]RAV00263.1 transcriptional regulator [Mycolicibacter senuensis]
MDLAGLRRTAGLTQVELAANLGVGQAQVSKIERQSDMLLSTLSAYLTALGVEARVVVEVDGQTLNYGLTAGEGR